MSALTFGQILDLREMIRGTSVGGDRDGSDIFDYEAARREWLERTRPWREALLRAGAPQ